MMGQLYCREEEEYKYTSHSTQHTAHRRRKKREKRYGQSHLDGLARAKVYRVHTAHKVLYSKSNRLERYLTPPTSRVCCQHTLQQKPYNTQQQHTSTRTQNAQVNSFGSAPVRTSSNNNANRVQQQHLIIIFDRHLVFYLYILMIEIDDILRCIIGECLSVACWAI
jgi:hypothetical protein